MNYRTYVNSDGYCKSQYDDDDTNHNSLGDYNYERDKNEYFLFRYISNSPIKNPPYDDFHKWKSMYTYFGNMIHEDV